MVIADPVEVLEGEGLGGREKGVGRRDERE